MHPNEVEKLEVVRALEKFRVIALVSPDSSSLDRLLQTRFQARYINQVKYIANSIGINRWIFFGYCYS